MVDPYAIVRRLTGHELISPKDARLLTEAVDGLIGEIGSKDARVKELEAENARLRERQAEADRVIDRLKLALQAERQKPMRCAACNGDGQVSRSYGYIPCDACNGRGF